MVQPVDCFATRELNYWPMPLVVAWRSRRFARYDGPGCTWYSVRPQRRSSSGFDTAHERYLVRQSAYTTLPHSCSEAACYSKNPSVGLHRDHSAVPAPTCSLLRKTFQSRNRRAAVSDTLCLAHELRRLCSVSDTGGPSVIHGISQYAFSEACTHNSPYSSVCQGPTSTLAYRRLMTSQLCYQSLLPL